MRRDTFRLSTKLAWVILLLAPGSVAQTAETAKIAALPAPVSDNAVVSVKSRGGMLLFSFMGMGSKKTWDAVTNTAFYIDPAWEKWYPVNRVPGPVGRLAAAAASARGSIFIFGGYVVDDRNRGIVVPDANIYDVDA
jgi:N-acetylneuraminic acid mutarotase